MGKIHQTKRTLSTLEKKQKNNSAQSKKPNQSQSKKRKNGV